MHMFFCGAKIIIGLQQPRSEFHLFFLKHISGKLQICSMIYLPNIFKYDHLFSRPGNPLWLGATGIGYFLPRQDTTHRFHIMVSDCRLWSHLPGIFGLSR